VINQERREKMTAFMIFATTSVAFTLFALVRCTHQREMVRAASRKG
jgi:hypothetical protein